MTFSVAAFAAAGAAAALGPIVIHLLHRRRFRTVDWAAMQFLRQAVRQSRRILHLRDILLLILRTAAVLLFGLAMARPYFSSGSGSFGAGEPVHAVVLLDNSLSMAYRTTSGTLLDLAKAKCRRFIEALPPGSRTAVVPVCSDPTEYSLEPAATKQGALEALDAVRSVDRRAGIDAALELGKQALRRLPDMPNKRTVLVGDGQKINFPADGAAARAAELGDVQLVVVRPDVVENAWVAELRAVDGVAAAGAATEFAAVVRYEGPARRSGVQVTLAVDGATVETHVIDLEPGSRRLVTFTHKFPSGDGATAAGPRFADVAVSLSNDRLAEDDERHLVVPIVEPLPILYVSDYGPDMEVPEAAAGRGLWIQRLLAPVVERGETEPKAVRITHVAASSLDATLVQNARLIVLAGLRTPGDKVVLLRDYVEQGGQLLITAGDDFDPSAWTEAAWLDGGGILPAPLAPKVASVLDAENARPLRLDRATLGHRWFQLEGAGDDELNDLYSAPAFLAVVAAEPTDAAVAKLAATETARIVARREARAAAAKQTTAVASIPPTLRLPWIEPAADRDHELPPDELASRSIPSVVGRYDDGLPFLVERRLDRGSVVLCTTGLQSAWSTLTMSRAVVVLDRMTRDLLGRTLPKRNYDTNETALVPTRPTGSGTYYQLARPGDRREAIVVDALGDDKYALVLRNLADRGVYRLTARQAAANVGDAVVEQTVWTVPIAAGGPEAESHLAPVDEAKGMGESNTPDVRWVDAAHEINVAGASVRGQNLWKWLMAAVVACLLAELGVLRWMRPAAASSTEASP